MQPGKRAICNGAQERASVLCLAKGASDGVSPLDAFDAALYAAGVGDYNLVCLSSVLPPGVRVLRIEEFPADALPGPGAIVHAVIARGVSANRGAQLSAAIAVGIPLDPACPGIIMEVSLEGTADQAESVAIRDVERAMQRRNCPTREIASLASTHRVDDLGCACVVALLI